MTGHGVFDTFRFSQKGLLKFLFPTKACYLHLLQELLIGFARKIDVMEKSKITRPFLLTFLVHFSLGLLLYSHASAGSELGNLATHMQPGTWASLPTNNLTSTVAQTGGSSNFAFTFMPQHGIWFPSVKKAMFVGGDHNGGNERLMIYDDATNTWSKGPTPPGGWQQNHGHGYNAGDTIQNKLYYHLTGSVYNINSGSWSGPGSLPNSISGLGRANNAFAYLPGHGNFEFGAGGIWRLPDGGAWQELAPFRTYDFGGIGGELSPFAIYNHVLDAIWFGGGDGTNNTFLLKWDGSQYVVTQLPDPPVDQISGNNGGAGPGTRSQLDYDPATGDLLLFDKAFSAMGFYAFNAGTNTWSSLPTPPFSTADVNDIVTFPVTSYGVNVAIEYLQSTQTATMHVYKHGQGSQPPIPDTSSPSTPTNLSAIATSSSQINLSWNPSTDNVGVANYKVFRNATLISSPTGTSYSDTGLSANTTYTYTIAAQDTAGNVSPQTTSVSTTTPSSTQPPPPPSGSMTFEQVCALGTTINCWGFESEEELYYTDRNIPACDNDPFLQNHVNGPNNHFGLDLQSSPGNVIANADNNSNECIYPKRDLTQAASGNASLRFRIPSESGPQASGDFSTPFKRFGSQPFNYKFARFGQGGEFWVRFAMRQNEALISRTDFYQAEGGGHQGGVKRLIVHGFESSETLEETLQDTWQRRVPQMYSNSGNELYGVQDVIGCLENDGGINDFNNPDHYPEPPCRQFISNQWRVYQIYVKVADNAPNFDNGVVRLYLDDEPDPIIEVLNSEMNASSFLQNEPFKENALWDGNENGYGKLSFTLFSTNKAPTVHEEGAMWIDDVVVSHTRVPPIAGTGSSSGDTTPPSPPTGLNVQ